MNNTYFLARGMWYRIQYFCLYQRICSNKQVFKYCDSKSAKMHLYDMVVIFLVLEIIVADLHPPPFCNFKDFKYLGYHELYMLKCPLCHYSIEN